MKIRIILTLLIQCLLFYTISSDYYSIKLDKNVLEKNIKVRELSLLEAGSKFEQNILNYFEKEEDMHHITKLIDSKSYVSQNEIASIPVANYFDVQYYGNVYVGSSYQQFSVIFDTGSNVLWISSQNCVDCRNYTTKFSSNTSNSFRDLEENKNITYAIGYVNGTVVEDDVYISQDETIDSKNTNIDYTYSMGVNNFTFLLVNEEKYLNGTIADGVLGLGNDFEGDYHNSFVYMLYKQGKIKKPQFSFYLTDSKKGSRLYMGDITENPALSSVFNKMQYCIVKDNSLYWQCNLNNIEIKNPQIDQQNNETNIKSHSKVIFDTGTSFLIIPASEFISIFPHFLSKALNNKCGLTPLLQFVCQCRSPKDFDDVILYLSNGLIHSKLVIKSENIIDYFPTLEYQCQFEIVLDILWMDAWILGDSVLRDSIITFDMGNKQIGWVQDIDRISDFEILNNDSSSMDQNRTDAYLWYILAFALILGASYLLFRLAYYFGQRSIIGLNRDDNINS